MERFDRRRFMTQALIGSGALPILGTRGVKARTSAQQTGSVRPPAQGVLGPNSAVQPIHGRILSVSGSTLAVDAVEGLRPASVVGARLWKGEGVAADKLESGDVVWGRGVQLQDGTLLINQMWVNIVNVTGIVDTIVSSTAFVMQWGPFGIVSDSTKKTNVAVDRRTIFNNGSRGSRGRLVVGRTVQVIGMARDEDTIHATRVFV
jgi:hypothetical protein